MHFLVLVTLHTSTVTQATQVAHCTDITEANTALYSQQTNSMSQSTCCRVQNVDKAKCVISTISTSEIQQQPSVWYHPVCCKSAKDVKEWKRGFLRLQKVAHKADCACKPFVQAVRRVRCPGTIQKLRSLQELGKFNCTVKIELVASEAIQQQEDIATASHTMTDAGAFLQQTTLPR